MEVDKLKSLNAEKLNTYMTSLRVTRRLLGGGLADRKGCTASICIALLKWFQELVALVEEYRYVWHFHIFNISTFATLSTFNFSTFSTVQLSIFQHVNFSTCRKVEMLKVEIFNISSFSTLATFNFSTVPHFQHYNFQHFKTSTFQHCQG